MRTGSFVALEQGVKLSATHLRQVLDMSDDWKVAVGETRQGYAIVFTIAMLASFGVLLGLYGIKFLL